MIERRRLNTRSYSGTKALAVQCSKPDGFCGLGFHRGPYGGCVRNGVPYGYVAPVVVPPYAAPAVVAPRVVCPYGYYYYVPYGRWVPTP